MYSVPVSFVSYRREPRRIAPRRHTTYKVTTHRSPGISYHSPGFMPHEFGMDPFMNDTMGMWNHHLNLNDVEPEKTEWTERIVCTGYAPDEVTLNVNGDKLEIHCVHKEGEEDDQEIREKKRTIEIPDNVNAEDISADMTDAGILVLTAPLIPAEEEETPSAEAASSSSEADKTKGINITRESASTTSSEKKKADDSDNTREIAITTKKEEKKVKVQEPKKPYELEVDMRDYKPESIEVKLSDNSLTVIGNQEKSDSFTGRKSSRSLTRNFFIPLDVDTDRLSSKLTAEGKLKITAPYKGEEQTIPVKKN